MKLLLETCVSREAVEDLRPAGYDVIWAGEWPDDPGDDEITKAYTEGRILVTFDKDFGELAIVHNVHTVVSFAWSIVEYPFKGKRRGK